MNELIKTGEGQSKFDNTIGDLITLRRLIDQANMYSQTDQIYLWERTLHAIERELYSLLNEQEKQKVNEVRITGVPSNIGKNYPVELLHRKLDKYHKALLELRFKKGLSIQAGEDARTAVLR
jgi:hypothetical protein